ncbi:hypothetical protein WA026_016537 [Henosepilachna vigintioctopunctata]|uniref:Uncharacterized protein n=1 Tax=Henosepilachna vigintioctopunctata TaxID=420089 RepID=A0AAW1VHA1_9CUCU
MPYSGTEKRTRQLKRIGKATIITASPYKAEEDKTIRTETKQKEIEKKTNERNKKADEEPQKADYDDTTECLYYHGLYSEFIEGWITCQTCGNGLVAVQEWKITTMKPSISVLLGKMKTMEYVIPHLTLGGTLSCLIGGTRHEDFFIFLKLIFL